MSQLIADRSGLVLLSTVDASAGAATVDFENEITAAFDAYKIRITELHGNGSRFFGMDMRFKKAGAYLTTNTYQWVSNNYSSFTSTVEESSTVNSSLIKLGAESSEKLAYAGEMEIDITNVNSTTKRTLVRHAFSGYRLGDLPMYMFGMGYESTLGKTQGIRLMPGGVSFYGICSIYGVKK